MLRRPPRSTLFPYNDALPISQRRAESGPEYEEKQEWLGERCNQSPPVAPVAKDVAVPDDVDRAQAGHARVDGCRLRPCKGWAGCFHAHRRRPIQRLAMARLRSRALTSSSRM